MGRDGAESALLLQSRGTARATGETQEDGMEVTDVSREMESPLVEDAVEEVSPLPRWGVWWTT